MPVILCLDVLFIFRYIFRSSLFSARAQSRACLDRYTSLFESVNKQQLFEVTPRKT